MIDNGIEKKVAFQIVNHLVHLYPELIAADLIDANRFDVRIEHGKLARPIGAHRFSSMDVATFHSVRPFDGWMHERQDRIDIAGVKVPISRRQ